MGDGGRGGGGEGFVQLAMGGEACGEMAGKEDVVAGWGLAHALPLEQTRIQDFGDPRGLS